VVITYEVVSHRQERAAIRGNRNALNSDLDQLSDGSARQRRAR
jgi:hypothetical protein